MNILELFLFSWKELIRNKKSTFLLILNFSLGIFGFFILQIFQENLMSQTAQKSQALLGGDISISARRVFSEDEVVQWEKLTPYSKKTQIISLFSMLIAPNQDSKLVNLQIIDSDFPLYGNYKVEGADFNNAKLNIQPHIWIDKELSSQLDLVKDQWVQIGEQKFKIAGFIIEDPTRMFRASGFASKAFIHKNYLQAAQLIKPGSTLNETWLYQLKEVSKNSKLKISLENAITDPIVQIESSDSASMDSNRIFKYFTDYLGLVSLVAFGLCLLCGKYLIEWSMKIKRLNIAILKSLGLSDVKIFIIYFIQMFLVSILACFLSTVLIYIFLPVIQNKIFQYFQLSIQLQFPFRIFIELGLIGVLSPLIIVIPSLISVFQLQALQLFQNEQNQFQRNYLYYIWIIFVLILFWFLTYWLCHSFKMSNVFILSLISLVLFFDLIYKLILKFIDYLPLQLNWYLKYSKKALVRKKSSTILVFITMSLSTLVLSLLPHIKNSIMNELLPAKASSIPKLFLFDIQPEQVERIQDLAKKILYSNDNFSKLIMNPLVRSRILYINEQKYEKLIFNEKKNITREQESEMRFRNRGVNLSYRSYLQESEKIIKGIFKGKYNGEGLPEISLEEKYADQVNIKIGDTMTFDVQGVNIKARVGSFRQVRWTSFQPNFFILFPENVLEMSPQIYLTSISDMKFFDEKDLQVFQKNVLQEFKNISIIDVQETVKSSLVYLNQMALALQLMSWMAILVGLLVFVILLNTQISETIKEMNLLQVLGAGILEIRRIIAIQFLIIMTLSLSIGLVFGLFIAYLIMAYFFNIQVNFDFQNIFILIVSLIPISGFLIFLGTRKLNQLNPIELLK